MRVRKPSLPHVESGDLAVVQGLTSPDECLVAVQDLDDIKRRVERIPHTFDQRWHPDVPVTLRRGSIAPLLGNSRSFVEAQTTRLDFADELLPMLSSIKPRWSRMTGVVKMLSVGLGKPVGTDGVRDLRIAIATGPMTLEIGKNKTGVFQGLCQPLEAGDGVVINNLCGPGEKQVEYGINIPPESGPQAVLQFCLTD